MSRHPFGQLEYPTPPEIAKPALAPDVSDILQRLGSPNETS
jgi:hypothetical protein